MSVADIPSALVACQRSPRDFGLAARAAVLLFGEGQDDVAAQLGRRFAAATGAAATAGVDFLMVVRRARRLTLEPGEVMLEEGARGDLLYVIVHGRARVSREGVGTLAVLGPGVVVGEIAPLANVARTATVAAETEVQALVFDADALELLGEHLPGAYAEVLATGRTRLLAQMVGPGSIFADLEDHERELLYARCVPCTLPEGTRILREGQVGNAVCIIASGHADVWRRTESGRRELLGTLGPGEVFGEMSVLFERVASATVEAITPLTIFALDSGAFHEALARSPEARGRVERLARARLPADFLENEATPLPVVTVMRRR